MRFHCALLLFDLLVTLSAAAPVPKRPPQPPALTADRVVGTWAYAWGQFPDGLITFAKDGSYTAQHVPGGATVYAGTWTLDGQVLTIHECSYDFATGQFRGGPTDYAFDFAGSKFPKLSGLSNGTVPVALTSPTR